MKEPLPKPLPPPPVLYVGGVPVPVGRQPMTGAEIVEQLKNALATDYTGRDIEKVGMTKGAAMMARLAELAQDGDLDAISMLLDRLLGKPTQQVHALNVSATLGEFLDELNRRQGGVPNGFDPGPGTPTGPVGN